MHTMKWLYQQIEDQMPKFWVQNLQEIHYINSNKHMHKQKNECILKMISLSFIYSIQIHEIQWWWQSSSQLISKTDDS